jgi:hypothetical protein
VSYRVPVEVLLILAGGLFLTSLLGGGVRARQRAAIAGGARVRSELEAAYAGEHEYTRVDPAEFMDADLDFYREAARAFEAQGFRHLADVEDLTLTRIHPDSRTFLRVFVDDGRMIRAAAYHVRPRGALIAMLQVVRMAPRSLYIVELVSELPRGRFLSTSNTSGLVALELPPELKCERLAPDCKIAALVEHHRARLTETLRRDPGASPETLENYDAVLASVQRSNLAAARHRAKLRGLSRDELERLRGRPLDEIDEAFLHEVQRSRTDDAN